MSKEIIHTKDWIEQFVIGYNLCPFATRPFREDRIRYVIYDGTTPEELLNQFAEEAHLLQKVSAQEIETTLLIHPNMYTSFWGYLELFEVLLERVEELELDQLIQLASFHPDYQFDETEFTAPENFTNRSPYPMTHLLRVPSVSRAIDEYPDVTRIPANNIARMQQIGSEQLIKRYHEIIEKN